MIKLMVKLFPEKIISLVKKSKKNSNSKIDKFIKRHRNPLGRDLSGGR